MAQKGIVNGINGIEAVFASSRNIGTDGTEDLGTLMCTEGAGYFLLYFDHTHIAFDQVVIKGDAEIIHGGEDASFPPFYGPILILYLDQFLGGRSQELTNSFPCSQMQQTSFLPSTH